MAGLVCWALVCLGFGWLVVCSIVVLVYLVLDVFFGCLCADRWVLWVIWYCLIVCCLLICLCDLGVIVYFGLLCICFVVWLWFD